MTKNLAELNEKRGQLERRLAASSELAAKLEEQRGSLLVGGLTGDAGAQKKLQQVNSEIQDEARSVSDLSDAIGQIDAAIRALEAAAKTAAREQQREALRSLIQGRITEQREQRIVILLRKLETELGALESSTNEIAQGLRAFDPRLEGLAQNLQDRERLFAFNLRSYGLRSLDGSGQHASAVPVILANVLRILDRANVEEEVAAGAGA